MVMWYTVSFSQIVGSFSLRLKKLLGYRENNLFFEHGLDATYILSLKYICIMNLFYQTLIPEKDSKQKTHIIIKSINSSLNHSKN